MMASKAQSRQPVNFDGLTTVSMQVNGVVLSRFFSCQCGNDKLHIRAGAWDGESGWLDPVYVQCPSCAQNREIFNSKLHGYDGLLCGGAAALQNEHNELVLCPKCDGDAHRLQAGLCYNIDYDDPTELAGLDEEFRSRLSDLYDFLELSANCGKCEAPFSIGDWDLA